MNKRLIVIMGPTGSGKTKLALQLSKLINSEIISADSMQVYRGMDIGTAKPTLEERGSVPHHMIDILDIHQRLDIYFYVKRVKAAISEIMQRNKTPIIAGGSGLYIKSVLYGLDPLPSDPKLRDELFTKYETKTEEFKKIISKLDPKAFAAFRKYPRKLIRALEVLKLTGKSIIDQHLEWDKGTLKYENVFTYNIKLSRPILFDRIARRTEGMLNNGWIDETRSLIQEGLLKTPTAKQAIGYPIIAEYLSGNISYEEMKVRIISLTKKYARRQETWFNNQHPEAKQLQVDDFDVEKLSKIVLEDITEQ